MPKTTHGVNSPRPNQSDANTDRQLVAGLCTTSGGATTVSVGRYQSGTTWRSGMFGQSVSGTPRHPVNIKITLHTPPPLYRGQPGYSSKLDRDGDGVACETGSSVYSPGRSIPAPAIPSASVPQPVPTPIPAPALQSGGSGAYETVVNWTGTDCIDITAPDSSPAGVLATSSHCGGTARFSHEANSSQLVGADPIMGAAESITCEILVGRLRDSGTRGDGHDVNCLTRADALRASA